MANRLQFRYDIVENSMSNSTANGKWYARAKHAGVINLRGLADHIADHGSVYTRDIVIGVLTKFTGCLVELCTQGARVKFDGLGTFYINLETDGAETPVGYNINEHLKGAHLRFLPDDSELDKLTSREMKTKITLKQNMIFDKLGVPKKVVDGQLVDYGEKPEGDGDGGDDQNP